MLLPRRMLSSCPILQIICADSPVAKSFRPLDGAGALHAVPCRHADHEKTAFLYVLPCCGGKPDLDIDCPSSSGGGRGRRLVFLP